MAAALLSTVPCGICENQAAKFYCNTCGNALCATCKTHHLRRQGSKYCDIVPYAQKLNPKYLANLLCHTHNTDAAEYWCDTCDVPICGSCITEEQHRGHHFSKITVILSRRRDLMREDMKTLRDNTVVEWEKVLKQAQEITADFISDIDDVDKELDMRAQDIHREVKVILAQSRQNLQQMKSSCLSKLYNQEIYISDRLQRMKDDVRRCEEQLKDGDQDALLKYKQGSVQCNEEPPTLETASVPSFTKGENDTNILLKMFGQLSTCPSSSSTKHASLIPNPSVHSKFNVDYCHPQIACGEGGFALVQTGEKMLQLMDKAGSVRDTINTDFSIYNMAVTRDGELLLADHDHSCIKSVVISQISKSKTITTLFRTNGKPYSLCCFHNNEILITFPDIRNVGVYRSGEIKRALNHIKFSFPLAVSVNKVNSDIYICDHEGYSCETPGKVIAIGAGNQPRYEYAGQGDKFTPVEVCSDKKGHVLITDFHNHQIHILDMEGQFLQFILTSKQGLHRPKAIDVDKEGNLWVGENFDALLSGYLWYDGRVKVAKYMQRESSI